MNVLGPNDCIFSSLDNISFLSAPCLTIFVKEFFWFEVQVRLWRNEHFVTKWLLWLSESLHPNVHKGIPKHHAKFGPNRISNIGDIDFYRKIGLVWFALVWFGSVWFFVVQNIKLCLEKWYVKFENNWLRNGWDMTQNVLLYLVKIVLYTNPHINISLSRSNVCVADIAWKYFTNAICTYKGNAIQSTKYEIIWAW